MITTAETQTITEFSKTIHKHAKKAENATAPAIQAEHRRRAWVLMKLVSEITQHFSEADLYYQMSLMTARTAKDRARCASISNQETNAACGVMAEFMRKAAEFDNITAKAAIAPD
jgi:hypothetical protein